MEQRAEADCRAELASDSPTADDLVARVAEFAVQPRGTARRLARMNEGVRQLLAFLDDLARHDIESLEERPPAFWQTRGSRLIDAQAPGLSRLLLECGEVVGKRPNWRRDFLQRAGRLALLCEAFLRLEALDPAFREDVRQLVGISLKHNEVMRYGLAIRDEWHVIGRRVETEDRLLVERCWIVGRRTGKTAVVLQFAFGQPVFPIALTVGAAIEDEIHFWPGAVLQRARFSEAHSKLSSIRESPAGHPGFDSLFQRVAKSLARNPFIQSWPAVVANVRLAVDSAGGWSIIDLDGGSLPLQTDDPLSLAASTGGSAFTVAGIWNGAIFRLLGHYDAAGYVDSASLEDNPAPASTPMEIGLPCPADWPEVLKSLGPMLERRDPPRALLLAAAIESICSLAGARPNPGCTPLAPPPSDPRSACPPATASAVQSLLENAEHSPVNRAILLETVGLLEQKGRRLPDYIAPAVLRLADAELRTTLRLLLGPIADWLQELMLASTNSAVGAGQLLNVESASLTFEEFSGRISRAATKEVPDLFIAFRRACPEEARDWLKKNLGGYPPAIRSELLSGLELGLSSADEPLLANALKDRSANARNAAFDLLVRLENSEVSRCLRDHAGRIIAADGEGAKSTLRLRWPDEDAIRWIRSNMPLPERSTIGKKALCLATLLGKIDPCFWTEERGMNLAQLVGIDDSEWTDAVLSGLAAAAVFFQRQELALACWNRIASELRRPKSAVASSVACWLPLLLQAVPAESVGEAIIQLSRAAAPSGFDWLTACRQLQYPMGRALSLRFLEEFERFLADPPKDSDLLNRWAGALNAVGPWIDAEYLDQFHKHFPLVAAMSKSSASPSRRQANSATMNFMTAIVVRRKIRKDLAL